MAAKTVEMMKVKPVYRERLVKQIKTVRVGSRIYTYAWLMLQLPPEYYGKRVRIWVAPA